MNDIRRTILWVIFAFSLVMLWDQWQVHNGRKATFFPSASAPAARASAPAAAPPASSVPPAAGSAVASSGVPGATAGVSSVPANAAVPHERIEVTTDVLKLVFDSEGGAIVKSEFLKYHETGHADQPFVLLDTSANRVYQAQSGLIGGPFPTHKTPMKFSGERQLADGAGELVLRFESPEVGGVRLIKTYTLKRGAYVIDVRHEVVNQGGQPVSPQLYVQLVRDGNKPPGESSFYSTFTGPAFYTDAKKFQKVDFSDIAKGKAEFANSAPDGWVAMVQHYFASAWLPPAGMQRENFARKVDDNLYAAGSIAPVGTVAPGAARAVDTRLFIGPQEEKVLESIAPGLELVKDYGFFTILSKPLYWLLDKLHGVIGNWGWSIVALVVLLKIAFYWFNAKAYQSMAKMKAINPKVMDLRERYKDNPQQMQMEMMRVYREEKVNPMGGCLPIVIQIPVFIALYWVLLSSVEMRGAPWILWIKDLSVRDPYFILPIVMTLTTLLQTALNPLPPDPMQAKLMWFMPLIFSVMFFFFPAGLVLYWITNNILTIAQQWVINTRMGVPPKFNLPKF
ncbi:membrane protein insertase YidC [Ottowia testudinis]|uniref:Membrane protein insertase YidC n=1 Tax=Ottowia testudinis TaxID=2816950 RepID=A0A975CGH8_9BURK|nr:membrane protein insertase YidC [Ottowia testudinis]QTD45357.1 membrane protein insertase YidC [Ottowia testudinis]